MHRVRKYRIKPAVDLVEFLIAPLALSIGLQQGNDLRLGWLADGTQCQQRRRHRFASMGHNRERPAQRIADGLGPDGVAYAAAANPPARRRWFHLVKTTGDCQARERDTVDHGAVNLGPGRIKGGADTQAARRRIPNWRT